MILRSKEETDGDKKMKEPDGGGLWIERAQDVYMA